MVHIDVLEKLQKVLNPISEEAEADAAVAVLLKPFNQDLQVLFVKRVENSTDPWSGQIALPGGKREPDDQNLTQTIAREVLEETSVNVLDHCRFLGTLAVQRSPPRPKMRILPFVILVEHEPAIKLDKQEIQSYFWATLEDLRGHRGIFKSDSREVDAYIVGNRVIWGTTYRILENLFQILEQ